MSCIFLSFLGLDVQHLIRRSFQRIEGTLSFSTVSIEDHSSFSSRHSKLEGDTKGPANAGDGFGKKDVVAVQPGPSNQIARQGSFTQGMSYMHSQNLFGGRAIKYSCRKLSEPGLN